MDRISYRQLQAFAKVMNLPGNMKYQVLWDLVQARRSGNERLVSQLLAEQNRIRINRRISRKAAKIEAEALNHLIKQEASRNAVASCEMSKEIISNSNPPAHQQVLNNPPKMKVAVLLDPQQRYNMIMNEGRFCRNAASELPMPPYTQVVGFHSSPTHNSSAQTVETLPDSVKLQHFSDFGNSTDNISHVEVITTDFRSKPPQFNIEEPKKTSFQIEDLIDTTPSTNYGQSYSNSYHYNGYIEITQNPVGTGYVSQPVVNVTQESDDRWGKQYSDLIAESHSVSSNGSQNSLFIDTNQVSPLSSGTISATEVCEEPPSPRNIEIPIETIEEVSLQPSYQTLATTFLSSLENPVLNDVDSQSQYSNVVEEITYSDSEHLHCLSSDVHPKSDTIELRNSEIQSDEMPSEDAKVVAELEDLQTSHENLVTTTNLKTADVAEEPAECDSSNVEVDKSADNPREFKIEKRSPIFSGSGT